MKVEDNFRTIECTFAPTDAIDPGPVASLHSAGGLLPFSACTA
jgi:hypothetical protein